MTLDEVEQHLYRCNTEVIRPQVQNRESKEIHLLSHWNPSVIACIVKHDDCRLPPVRIFSIKVSTQLGKEECESDIVSLPTVHRIHEVTITAHSCDQVHSVQMEAMGCLIPLLLWNPSMLSVVCISDDRLVNIDNPKSIMKCFYKHHSSILPLQFSIGVILDRSN